jgi:ComF family protein
MNCQLRAAEMVPSWSKRLQAWFYPPTCLVCGSPGSGNRDLCAACLAELPRNTHACTRCALPLPADTEQALCAGCLQRLPPFDGAYARFYYAGPVARLIQELKFKGRLASARLLGDLLAEGLAERADPLPELILAVPLHRARIRIRGFNQALELARPLSRALGIPLDPNRCVRIRATEPQTALGLSQRCTNLRGAFQLRGRLTAHHVALVDDVMTTGSTAAEMTRVLRQAGVRRIDVWACARAAEVGTPFPEMLHRTSRGSAAL